jgi:hypothetical protein
MVRPQNAVTRVFKACGTRTIKSHSRIHTPAKNKALTTVTSLRTLCEGLLADLVLDQEWDCTRLPAECLSSVCWMALMRSIAT